jgi:hypothetical protein
MNPNERLFNAVFQNINPDSIESANCGNCLCCMNKKISQFAFCFELNKSVKLDDCCSNWESERN